MATLTLFRRIRVILHRFAELLWLAAFRLLALFRAGKVPWRSAGGISVVVIAPHPDDEVLGCAGVIAQHLDAGDIVSVIIVTDGRLSRAGGLNSEQMAQARETEAKAAAGTLELSHLVMLHMPEGAWAVDALYEKLQASLDDLAPSIIYAPCWLDYHPEHRKVAQALARVVPADVDVRVYTLHIPLNKLANIFVDVSDQMNLIDALFKSYATQTDSLHRGLRLRRYLGACYNCGRAAETFWSLSGAAYRNAHTNEFGQPRVRGMRYWSFTDPLAFLIGGRDRRELKLRSSQPK